MTAVVALNVTLRDRSSAGDTIATFLRSRQWSLYIQKSLRSWTAAESNRCEYVSYELRVVQLFLEKTYLLWYTRVMKKLAVYFYRTETGTEPVRKWLQSLSKEDRKTIGEDMKTVQLGWPMGMPLVDNLEQGLWEVRIKLSINVLQDCCFLWMLTA